MRLMSWARKWPNSMRRCVCDLSGVVSAFNTFDFGSPDSWCKLDETFLEPGRPRAALGRPRPSR